MGRFERNPSSRVIVTLSVSAVVATGVGLGVPLIADAAPIPVAVAANGPAPITGGQVRGLANNEVSGAVQAVVPNPADAAELWVGTVNGGVWHTTNATAASPNWTPTMDDLPETSIGALALDPTIPSNSVLVAGLGNTSSNGRIGSALTGILRTTNAGASWTRLGVDPARGPELHRHRRPGKRHRGVVDERWHLAQHQHRWHLPADGHRRGLWAAQRRRVGRHRRPGQPAAPLRGHPAGRLHQQRHRGDLDSGWRSELWPRCQRHRQHHEQLQARTAPSRCDGRALRRRHQQRSAGWPVPQREPGRSLGSHGHSADQRGRNAHRPPASSEAWLSGRCPLLDDGRPRRRKPGLPRW